MVVGLCKQGVTERLLGMLPSEVLEVCLPVQPQRFTALWCTACWQVRVWTTYPELYVSKIAGSQLVTSFHLFQYLHKTRLPNAVVTCEIKLFQPSSTSIWKILFQRVETCLNLFHISTLSAAEIIVFQFQTWWHVK